MQANKILYLFAFISIIMSCKSKKSSITKTDTAPPPIATGNSKPPDDVLDNTHADMQLVSQAQYTFDYLTIKADCNYKDDKNNQDFIMNFRIRHDSAIWVSINSLGFEAARALITKDSIKILNRLQKEYRVYDFAFFKDLAGYEINYNQLENILIGNCIYAKENYRFVEKNKFDFADTYIKNSIIFNTNYKIIESSLMHLIENNKLNIKYEFAKNKNQLFNKSLIEISIGEKVSNLKMKYVSTSDKKIDTFPFEISSKYNKK